MFYQNKYGEYFILAIVCLGPQGSEPGRVLVAGVERRGWI